MLEIIRLDDLTEIDGMVVRYQFRVSDEKRAPNFPKGEIRASRHGVMLVGPFFPMNTAAARLVQAALERAWLQADYMAWAWARSGKNIALSERELSMAQTWLRKTVQKTTGVSDEDPIRP
jgi:hypothetical protein